jgi:hypothetical protein
MSQHLQFGVSRVPIDDVVSSCLHARRRRTAASISRIQATPTCGTTSIRSSATGGLQPASAVTTKTSRPVRRSQPRRRGSSSSFSGTRSYPSAVRWMSAVLRVTPSAARSSALSCQTDRSPARPATRHDRQHPGPATSAPGARHAGDKAQDDHELDAEAEQLPAAGEPRAATGDDGQLAGGSGSGGHATSFLLGSRAEQDEGWCDHRRHRAASAES